MPGDLPETFVGERVPLPPGMTVPRLITRQIAATPDAVAVVYEDTVHTYADIGRAAGACATRMRELGVQRDDLVPMVMRNGPELVVGILAAMSLSAVFVPMDAQWPRPRIDSLLDGIGGPVVLCSPGLPDADPRWQVVDTGGTAPLPVPAAGPDDVVYGFFTSGSTGTPKCALNTHRGLLNRFLHMTRRFGGRPDEVVLQTSRHVFDASLWQLLWPLTNGARVVIPNRDGVLDLDAIVRLVARHRVTVTDFVPSVFNILVDLLRANPSMATGMSSLHTVLIGGEEINPEAVHAYRTALPDVRIINTYGPTEASIGSVFHEVTDADRVTIPIGRPIDNTAALVLDEALHPATSGELYLGGACVGVGYLHDPDRTEAVFVPNPFPSVPGDRLYRTGDLAFLRPDGMIGYAGRRDHQVKIGGVRIELGEIENALLSHPQVHEAKVVVHGDDVKRLAAFVTSPGPLTAAEVRAHCRTTLSQDLMPARFTVLDRMPLTPTGKTDRAALVRAADQPGTTPAPDLTPDEQALCEIWAELLPGEPPRPSDSFFDVGGDSLSVQRLVVAIRTRLGRTISVRDVVGFPTLAELATRLSTEKPSPVVRGASRSVLAADVALPDDVGWAGQPSWSGGHHILLTGATGFVGAQLLSDLVRRTGATVHCLVRAADRRDAHERLASAMRGYRLPDRTGTDRVVAVAGDLTAPRLGLPEDEYRTLAERIDTVVHNGAMVNMVLPYEVHRDANVLGTKEILRLASTNTLKHVHFVSTLGLVAGVETGIDLIAEEPVPENDVPHNGYTQSKWVAEQVLDLGSRRGIPIAVHRLGEVMPSSVTGVPNPNAMSHLIIQACLRIGLVFTSDITVDYTPVDYVGDLLAAAVVNQVTGYHHVFQPRSVRLDELFARFRTEFGLREVSYPKFHQELSRAAAAGPGDRVLAAAMALLPEDDRLTTLFRDATRVFDTTRATRLALACGIRWAPVDSRVLRRYPVHVRSGGS